MVNCFTFSLRRRTHRPLATVCGVLIMGMIVNPTNPDLLTPGGTGAASPWVIAIRSAGIKGLPSVINTVVLLSAFVGPPQTRRLPIILIKIPDSRRETLICTRHHALSTVLPARPDTLAHDVPEG